MRYFATVLFFLVFLCYLCDVGSARDKTQSLENLQKLVNNPEQAKEMRRKVKNASKEELAQFKEIDELIKDETIRLSSSLPLKVDQYTTMTGAIISGKNVLYKCTLSNDLPGIKDKQFIMNETKSNIKKGICTSPSGAFVIFGYTWSYYYFREDGSYYGGVIIDAKTCGFE
jgi:hypothetical protein